MICGETTRNDPLQLEIYFFFAIFLVVIYIRTMRGSGVGIIT